MLYFFMTSSSQTLLQAWLHRLGCRVFVLGGESWRNVADCSVSLILCYCYYICIMFCFFVFVFWRVSCTFLCCCLLMHDMHICDLCSSLKIKSCIIICCTLSCNMVGP
ncbi:unnamed protein product [Heterosigma akashiwo]